MTSSTTESLGRHDLVRELRIAAGTGDRERSEVMAFQALFGLPGTLQLALPAQILERYALGFALRWPAASWVTRQLEDPSLPEGDFNEARLAFVGAFDWADDSFIEAVLQLTLAAASIAHPVWHVLSSLRYAILAHALRSWREADPEGARLQDEERQLVANGTLPGFDAEEKYRLPEHAWYKSPAFHAAVGREWEQVSDWLAAQRIWEYPDSSPTRIAEELAAWLPTRY